MRNLLVLAAITITLTSISTAYACGEYEDGPRVSTDTKSTSDNGVETSVTPTDGSET